MKALPWLFFGIITTVFFLLLSSLRSIVYFNNLDEMHYLDYAIFIDTHGWGGLSVIFKQYAGNPDAWFFPNPFRLGYIFLCSVWIKLFACQNILTLSLFSIVSFALLLGSVYIFLRGYYGEKVAFLTGLSLAFSPLSLYLARRALPDTLANLGIFLSSCLFFEFMQKRSLRWGIFFSCLFLGTVLIKESTVLFALPYLIFASYQTYLHKKSDYLKRAMMAIGAVFCSAALIYLLGSGSWRIVVQTLKIIVISPSFNEYAIAYGVGPWSRYLLDFIALSPVVFILAIGYFFRFLFNEKKSGPDLFLWVIFLGYFIISLFFTKNIRYLAFLDLPLRLSAVLMIFEIGRRFFPRFNWVFACTLIVFLAAFDYLAFRHIFILKEVYDPTSYKLLKALSLVPW